MFGSAERGLQNLRKLTDSSAAELSGLVPLTGEAPK